MPGPLQGSEMDNIGGSNILAVDDDPVLSDLMRRKMTIEGFEVQIRNSGKAALELLAQTQEKEMDPFVPWNCGVARRGDAGLQRF